MKVPKNKTYLIIGLIAVITVIVWFSVRDSNIIEQEAL